MSKKLGKLLVFSTLAGAVAAGTYYYLQKKDKVSLDNSDDIDDFDDFDDDFDEDFEESTAKSRPYVSLDLDNAKEVIGEKVIETLDKTKEKLVQFNVPEKLDKAKEFIGEVTASVHTPSENEYTDVSPASTEGTTSEEAPSEEAPAQTTASVSSTYASDDEEVPVENTNTEEFFDDTID